MDESFILDIETLNRDNYHTPLSAHHEPDIFAYFSSLLCPDLVKLIDSYITYEKSWFDQFLKYIKNSYVAITKTHDDHYDFKVQLTWGNDCHLIHLYFTSILNFNEEENLNKFKDNRVLTNDACDCIRQLIKMNDCKNRRETRYKIERNGEFLTLQRIENEKNIIIVENGKTFNELLVELYDDVVKN